MREELIKCSRSVRSRIQPWISVPCGIGIGHTTTIKACNDLAKAAEPLQRLTLIDFLSVSRYEHQSISNFCAWRVPDVPRSARSSRLIYQPTNQSNYAKTRQLHRRRMDKR